FLAPQSEDTIPGFRYNKNILIDHTKVASHLVDFPVLVDIWDEDLHFNVQPDGDDIAFLYNGQFLSHEIESFDKKGNGTHAHLTAWVRVPDISSVVDTTIVMVYGDEDLGSQEDVDGVWKSDYSAVWHLDENPSDPQWSSTYADYLPHQPQIKDSSTPSIDGTTYGSMTPTDLVQGKFGGAIDLDGSNDYLDFGNPAELQMTGAFTVEVWFCADFIDNDYLVVKSGESNYRGWDISFDDDATISPAGWVMFRFSPDGVSTNTVGYIRVDAGQWYHAVGVFSPSTYARFYLNGEMVGEQSSGVPASVNDPNRPLRIGRRSDNPGGTSWFDSVVDEVRISNVARSESWIYTQYSNQKNPGQFLTVGEERANFVYKKDISVDHNRVDEDLKGFPLLIDIYDSDLRTDVQADGDDIMFTSGGMSLPHEVELFEQTYNSTHAHLVSWVRTDLSSTSDTVISMYYGNPALGSQESPHEVWRNSYLGVWHLGESAGSSTDSTSFGTEGTISGGVTQGVAGQMGYGYDFDGTDGELNMGDPTDGHLDVGANDLTISMWISIDQTTGTWQVPINKGHPSALDSGYRFETSENGQNIYFQIGDGISYETSNVQSVTFGAWMHLVGRVQRSSNEMHLFRDGSYSGFGDITGIGDISSTNDLTISRGLHLSCPVDGIIDEIRISQVALSDGWISTEFKNQDNPDAFYSFGAEQLLSPSFSYKKDILVDHTKVNSDLTDFAVLIDIYDSDLRTKAQSDAHDIIFKSGDSTLPYEIEVFDQSYNSSHAHLVAWVKTDLSASIDTVISMYYGNPSVESQENPTAVWDDNYVGVWHLSEASGNARDSTSYKTNGTPSGAVTQGASGHIGNAYYFDRDGIGTVNMGDPADGHLDFGNTDDFTIEFWVNLDYFYYYEPFIVSKRNGLASSSPGYAAFVSDDNNGYAGYSISSDGPQFGVDATTPLLDTGWRHVVYVFDQDSDAISTIFVDGVDDKSSTWGTIGSVGSLQNSANFRLNGETNPSTEDMFDGMLDEVRISRVARSAEWVLTEFINQNEPASFYSVGAEESFVEDVQFDYSKDITIDHNQVAGDLMDFPVLIELFDTDLRTDVQADGDDIIFKSGESLLPHEIELFEQTYNSSHAHLIAWVKADLLSSTDTVITMYYGNPTLENQEDPAGVWNSNYAGVWHLSEDPTGTLYDSTTNLNHGNGYNLQSEDQVDGQIDGSIDFDNTQDYINCGNDTSLNVGSSDFSLSLWFKYDGVDNGVLAGKGAVTMARRYRISIETVAGYLMVDIDDDTVAKNFFSDSTYGDNLWHHASMVRDGNNLRLYIDGAEDPNSPIDITGYGSLDESESFYIGAFRSEVGGTIGYWSTANTDEVRVAKSALSPDWIATEHSNQDNPAGFYSVGAETSVQTIEFEYTKGIVVDHTKVDADLQDFPLLVNIYDTDLRVDVQADGGDIMFKSETAVLPHEIELFDQNYNSTHAHLVAWVKTNLSSTEDTRLMMYYGNPQTPNQESPTEVWNQDYMGVWHLGETAGGSGAIEDSTTNVNHGTDAGSPTFGISGPIGNAILFDGTDDTINCGNGPSLTIAGNTMTIEAWAYLNEDTAPQWGSGIAYKAMSYQLFQDWDASRRFSFEMNADSRTWVSDTNKDMYRWYHVAGVYDGVSTYIYVDGVQRGFFANTGPIDATGTPFYIGRGDQYFDGRIDEVRVLNV
ncbi:MAG: DUF2341 domain-containing protein, partial [Promethearchaeota archaeon]